MDNTELSHSDREFLVTAITRIEDQAMSGAVHGLQFSILLLDIKGKHIVLVILPVPVPSSRADSLALTISQT